MKINRAIKTKMATFLVMWFSGQLNDLEALAAALRELATEAENQITQSPILPGLTVNP